MVFKLLSILLRYPEKEVLEAGEDIAAAVQDLPDTPARAAMLQFLTYWENMPALRLREDYIDTFDFKTRNNLYLTYFRYGDQRLRGPALVNLKSIYSRAGYPMDTTELPDFLPLMLEFASVAPEGIALLQEYRGALEVIRQSLRQSKSPYALLLEALTLLLPEADETVKKEVQELIRQGPPQESVGLEPFGTDTPPPNAVTFYGRKR